MNIKSIAERQKTNKDHENLFEAEVEYVLDELQKRAHGAFREDSGSITDCAVEIGCRLPMLSQGGSHGAYWLRDMGLIVMHIMALMENHGYKVSEEILEIMAEARETGQKAGASRDRKQKIAV